MARLEKTCPRCCPTCTQTKACSVHCMAYNHPQGACQPPPPNPFQQLAEEFRRLAAFAHECLCYRLDDLSRASYETRQKTWEQAAQRLEALLEEVE